MTKRPRCSTHLLPARREDPASLKKAKRQNDEAMFLNETGIKHLQNGRDDEAEQCFCRALGALDAELSLPLEDESTLQPNKRSNTTEQTGPPYAQEAASMLYLYQRHEYDEGMHVYSEPLRLNHRDNPASCLLHDDQSSRKLLSCCAASTLLYNVAQTHVRRGKYLSAQKWFTLALLRIQVDSSGSIPAALEVKIKHNMGHCQYRLGRNEQALHHYEAALLTARQANLSEAYVASCLHCIAVLYFHQDEEPNKVLDYFKESLRVYRAHFGDGSRQVGTVLNNLGRYYYLQGDFDTALQVYRIALRIRRQVSIGKQESVMDLAATICNMGQTHQKRGELDQAMMHYKEFLELNQLGSSHRDVAMIYKCMAEIHHERRELDAAKIMYGKALHVARTAVGPNHPELATVLNKLGNLCYEMGDLCRALEHYKECLKVERVVLDPNHPGILVTLTSIAQIYKALGNWAPALASFKELKELQVQTLGPNDPQVARTLSSIGLMHYQLGAHAKAFETYQQALRIQRDHYDSDDHLEIASTLNCIGLVLFNQRSFALAEGCFTDSLRIRRKLLGPDHRDVAILWYNMATICLETGQDDMAIQFYKETLRVEQTALGESHHDVVLTMQHLGLVHQQRGELDEALNFFERALNIERRKMCGNRTIAVGKLLNLIGNIHLQRSDVDKMMDCYVEASRLYRECPHLNETLVIAGYNFYGISKLHPPSAPTA